MEQKMIFGLVLGRLAILKKPFGADYEQLLRAFFSCFQGQKKINLIVKNILLLITGILVLFVTKGHQSTPKKLFA